MAEKSKKLGGHRTLLVDIGSASVGGALMVEHKSGVPELSHVVRVPIGTGSEAAKDVLPEAMNGALATLCKGYASLMKHGALHIVLAAPWHHARIRTIESSAKKPVRVSERSVGQLIEKYKNETPPQSGRADLEAVAIQVRVNGYPTSLTHPVEGSSVKVNLYESEVDAPLRSALSETASRELPGVTVSFHSFPLIAGTALRIASSENNFSFVDIGGEITDLGVIHADGIHYLASFPIGFQSVIRAMKSPDAASRLALYASGELAPEDAAATESSFITAFKAWIEACETALKEGSEQVPIPRTLFVMSDTEALPWIVKGIASGGSLHLAPEAVRAAMLQRFVDVGEGGAYDVFLTLASLFFHTGVREVVGEHMPSRVVYSS